MQLSTLVLPAPLGPISATSSAGPTASETCCSTFSPPKARLKSSTSSSAIPSPIAPVLLDIAIATALPARRLSKIEFAHVGMCAEPRGTAVEHDAAVFQDVAVVDHAHGPRRVAPH